MSEIYGTFSTAYVDAMRLRLSSLEMEAMRLRLSELETENKDLLARVAELEAENKSLRDRFSDADTERNVAQGALKAAFARVAELEARCKRLEEVGDNLETSIACGCGVDGPCQMCRRASEFWQQAKEAKP